MYGCWIVEYKCFLYHATMRTIVNRPWWGRSWNPSLTSGLATTATVHNTRSHVTREGPELPGAEATHFHHTPGYPGLFQSPNGECTHASVYALLFFFSFSALGLNPQIPNSSFLRMYECWIVEYKCFLLYHATMKTIVSRPWEKQGPQAQPQQPLYTA